MGDDAVPTAKGGTPSGDGQGVSAVDGAHAAPVVRAQRFELVDGTGTVRAVLEADDGATAEAGHSVSLDLCDGEGRRRVSLALTDHGPVLEFEDEGNVVLAAGVCNGREALKQGPYVVLADREGNAVCGWQVDDRGRVSTFSPGT